MESKGNLRIKRQIIKDASLERDMCPLFLEAKMPQWPVG